MRKKLLVVLFLTIPFLTISCRKGLESENKANQPLVEEASSVELPVDTIRWMNVDEKNYYGPPEELESYKRYKKRDFSKLVIATDKPSNAEAEQAIVHNIGDKVADLLEENKAHIVIGVCYKAPLQNNRPNDKEIVRVTAMVSSFNDKGENLGNIEHPLYIIYDFVKYQSNPTLWNLANYSQNIPFDYVLHKDRLKNINKDE